LLPPGFLNNLFSDAIPDFSYLDDLSRILAAHSRTLDKNKENLGGNPVSVNEVPPFQFFIVLPILGWIRTSFSLRNKSTNDFNP
jgi:hypothetical protein